MESSQHLAQNLKDARHKAGLTQAQLAKRCGIPRTTLSHVERGDGNPTLHVLSALSNGLGLPLHELLQAPASHAHVVSGAALKTRRGKSGVLVRELLPKTHTGAHFERMELPPGTRMVGAPHQPGTFEYICVERGQLEVWVAGEKLEVARGDVGVFAGDQRHSYVNVARSAAVAFSVVIFASAPPRFELHLGSE